MEQSESTSSTGYEHLRERAHEHLVGQGGRGHLDDLIRFMFGAATKPGLWRTLATAILEGDQRLIPLANDVWALRSGASATANSLGSATFVALDVETTGLQPRQHRITEIGLVRYERGRIVERYSQLVNPERRIPDYIHKLTGLTNSELIAAPRFKQIAEAVVAFIGESVLLGHNIGFDIAFLNGELERCRMPALNNRSLDTLPMSSRLLKRIRRPSLDRVARELGLVVRNHHRALADAELAGEIALRLIAIANQDGVRFDDIVNELGNQNVRTRVSRATATSVMSRSHLDHLPRRPGVYLMVDVNERILYIGKAKSIRDRVASYYAQPLGYTRKLDGLAEAIDRIDHIETGSDLVAQLLESQLIRRYQPPYNTMLRNSETYPYIRIDPANPWPFLRLVNRRKADGARYYGPFRQRALAREVVALLNKRFRLRTCSRGFRTPSSYGNPCMEYDLKRCPGPCIGRADTSEYRSHVRQLLEFMHGASRELPKRLEQDFEEASQSLRFETAKTIRHDLDLIERLWDELAKVRELEWQRPRAIVQRGVDQTEVQVLMIVGGIWWSHHIVETLRPDELEHRLSASWDRYSLNGGLALDHNSVDESSIVKRWERSPASEGWSIEFDPDEPGVWKSLSVRIRQLASGGLYGAASVEDVVAHDEPISGSTPVDAKLARQLGSV